MKWIRYISKCGILILHNYNKFIKKYARHPEKYPQEQRYNDMRNLLIKLTDRLGVVQYVNGTEYISDDDVCFYAPNHQSAYDPLLLVTQIPYTTTFVSKIELKKAPFAGKAITSLSGLFMDRNDLRQSLKVMKKVTESLQNGECNWMIYPEGTRSKDPNHKLGEFKHGTFKIAVNSGKPIIPVAIWGIWRILGNSKDDQYRKIPVQVSYLKPITYEEYKDMNTADIAKLVQSRIEEEIEKMKVREPALLEENNPRKYRMLHKKTS